MTVKLLVRSRILLTVFPAIAAILLALTSPVFGQAHVIQVIADKDSHFKIPGQGHAEITLKAGESVLFHIEAHKGKSWNRDGAIHGFTMVRAKDRAKVPGWDFELRSGMQELALTAPTEPGEYEVLCTVICSADHEGMRMKVIVVP